MSADPTSGLGRGRWVVVWLIGAIVIAAIAFAAGTFVTSPWQAAVENSREELTVPISLEEREFVSEVPTLQGEVSLGKQMDITAPEGLPRVVITEDGLKTGRTVSGGEVLIGVSGRPLFALRLAIPMYRDLESGMSGPDVIAVQEALAELGFYEGGADGEYGPGTANAVKQMYRRANYEPPESITETREVPGPPPMSERNGGNESETDPSSGAGAPVSTEGEAPSTGGDVVEVDLGTPLPMSEVVDIPPGQVTVLSSLKRGKVVEPDGVVLGLRTGSASVVGRVGVADADAFEVGKLVSVAFPGSGSDVVEVKISEVSTFQAGSEDGTLPGYDVTVELSPRDVDGVSSGVIATFTPAGEQESTRGLAVPLTAVRENSEGVYVLVDEATPREVHISLGKQTDGFAEILQGEGLKAGTKVLIGGSGE